eukprot:4398588-Pleurochrysis_carterae.AAC.1
MHARQGRLLTSDLTIGNASSQPNVQTYVQLHVQTQNCLDPWTHIPSCETHVFRFASHSEFGEVPHTEVGYLLHVQGALTAGRVVHTTREKVGRDARAQGISSAAELEVEVGARRSDGCGQDEDSVESEPDRQHLSSFICPGQCTYGARCTLFVGDHKESKRTRLATDKETQ